MTLWFPARFRYQALADLIALPPEAGFPSEKIGSRASFAEPDREKLRIRKDEPEVKPAKVLRIAS